MSKTRYWRPFTVLTSTAENRKCQLVTKIILIRAKRPTSDRSCSAAFSMKLIQVVRTVAWYVLRHSMLWRPSRSSRMPSGKLASFGTTWRRWRFQSASRPWTWRNWGSCWMKYSFFWRVTTTGWLVASPRKVSWRDSQLSSMCLLSSNCADCEQKSSSNYQ